MFLTHCYTFYTNFWNFELVSCDPCVPCLVLSATMVSLEVTCNMGGCGYVNSFNRFKLPLRPYIPQEQATQRTFYYIYVVLMEKTWFWLVGCKTFSTAFSVKKQKLTMIVPTDKCCLREHSPGVQSLNVDHSVLSYFMNAFCLIITPMSK